MIKPLSASDGSNGATGLQRTQSFLFVVLQLLLVAVVIHQFRIEAHRHFFPVFCLVIGGFLIHAWLPRGLRLPFFSLLSLTGLLFVLGTLNGLKALGVVGALIGICYLPIRFGLRIAILVAMTVALVLARSYFPLPFWPVVGSMLMFRLFIYMSECRRLAVLPSLASTVSYFFLLPNVCFPLFPVVDYRTFRDTWYDDDEWKIYQRGVTWIIRGVIHLLLYRWIRINVVPEAASLQSLPQVAFFMVANYSLYLQVSGQFHLITGLLHLFGFNLPRTHHLFFLASSFSDIWRRINIYWKDFMTKFFFFPAFFAARSRGTSVGPAVVAGVLCVFIATWLLHSWQTFWLLGRFPLTINDACLWLGVGLCVAVNSLLETRRRGTPVSSTSTWINGLRLSVQTVAMFALVSLFWACWTRPGFLSLIAEVANRSDVGKGISIILMWMLIAIAAGTLLQNALRWQRPRFESLSALSFRESAGLHAAGLGVFLVFTTSWAEPIYDPAVAQRLAEFRADAATAEESADQLRSYYEDLNTAAIQAGPLISSFSPQQEARRAQAFGFYKVSRPADMYQTIELIPGVRAELEGCLFSVNSYGMRDRDTVLREKPERTVRIALMGSSIVMGYGVANDDVFGRVFENRLNGEYPDPVRRFEVLNFGVGKQWAPQRLIRFQRLVTQFDPDAVYYFAHQDEFQELAGYTAQLIAQDRKLPSTYLDDAARKAGVTSQMAQGAIQGHLQLVETELLDAIYRTIVDECRLRKITPVWIYLPVPGTDEEPQVARLFSIATNAGFLACDLSDWASSREGLFRTAQDHHPNARGHQLIAEALLRMVRASPESLPLVDSSARSAGRSGPSQK